MKGALNFDGFSEWLDNVQRAGVDIDDATARAVDAGADVALAGMRKRVRRRNGDLAAQLSKSGVVRDGSNFAVDVGLIDLGKVLQGYGRKRHKGESTRHKAWHGYPREFLYGVFQEFGTAKMKAKPYIRPTFDNDRTKIRTAQVESLKRDGMA